MTVPDLWFSATTGVLSRLPDAAYARVGFTFELRAEFPPCDPNELPADAVGPLGDVAALLAEFRAVVDGYDNGEFPDKLTAFDRIRAITDREMSRDAEPEPAKEKP